MTSDNQILDTIRARRSRRRFIDKDISGETIDQLLEAARWAPSGLNNQPWRFLVIESQDTRYQLAQLTKYSRIVQSCNVCILVYYHIPSGYNRDKDIMSIGAAIQNILLAAESLNLGAVWLGEILNQKEEVNRVAGVDDQNELMAVISLGYSDETPEKGRKNLDELILKG